MSAIRGGFSQKGDGDRMDEVTLRHAKAAEARENVKSIKRVPRGLLDDTFRDNLIIEARQGLEVYAYTAAGASDHKVWNLWYKGKRILLGEVTSTGQVIRAKAPVVAPAQ